MEEYVAPVFKLSDLAQLYKQHLEQLGAATTGHVNTSRLKERLLSVFPDLGTSSISGSERNLSSKYGPTVSTCTDKYDIRRSQYQTPK